VGEAFASWVQGMLWPFVKFVATIATFSSMDVVDPKDPI